MSNLQQTAGDIVVEKIDLITSTGEKIDLTNFYMEITLSESIYSPCMFGNVVIADAANILGKAFFGDEKLVLRAKSPYLEDNQINVIEKTFDVYSITNRKLENDRQQFFSIDFMSPEATNDSITKVNKKFKGSTDAIASEIYNEYLSEGVPLKLLDAPHSTNNFEFISTYWSPFKCLNYLAKNSIGSEYLMPNVMFFESNKFFYFTSLTSLVQEQKKAKVLYDEYSYLNNLDEIFEGKEENRRGGGYAYTSPFFSNTQITVSAIDYPVYDDQLNNRQSGYYGSTTFSYDYSNKDMYDIRFDYTGNSEAKNILPENFYTFKHITNNPPFPRELVKSNPLSVIRFKAGASGLFSENDAFNIEQVTATCYRHTALAEMKAIVYEITVPGKTDVEVGKLIRFNYPSVGEKLTNPSFDDLLDPKVSGIYIITGIRHSITHRGHTMMLEIVRDSIEEG